MAPAPTSGKMGDNPGKTRTMILAVLLVVVAIVALTQMWGSDGLVGSGSGLEEVDYAHRDLPVLESVGSDNRAIADNDLHRNPFTYGPPPTPTPNLTPKPTATPAPTRPPQTPPPVHTRGPRQPPKPVPPQFDRQYLGNFGPAHLQVAAFRKKVEGEDGLTQVEVAVTGEVLDGKFIIREIGLESVLIGYVGFDPTEDTRVPLAED